MTDPTLQALAATRAAQEKRYNSARSNILIAVILTVVNMALYSANSYFLFSAAVPYYLFTMGMLFGGGFPDSFYLEIGVDPLPFDASILFGMVIPAVLILAALFLCWLFSGKGRVGWMIAALVLFAVDTVGMVLLETMSKNLILNIVFHIALIVYLVMGIAAHFKLKKLPVITEADLAPAETDTPIAP